MIYIFLSYQESKKYVNNLHITSQKKWKEYCKSGNRPNYIPTNPDVIYKNNGWVSWFDWLGNKKNKNSDNFISYDVSVVFVEKLNITNQRDWIKYCKSGNLPNYIPAKPDVIYKNRGWVSWAVWFNPTKKRGRPRCEPKPPKEKKKRGRPPKPINEKIIESSNIEEYEFISYDELEIIIKKLNIKNFDEWKIFRKYENRPDNIPFYPDKIYKNKGWISWEHFFR
jgi:hypothetical protein